MNQSAAGVSRFSPHAWGWTRVMSIGVIQVEVFPTRVGVGRGRSIAAPLPVRFPHTRGGGP